MTKKEIKLLNEVKSIKMRELRHFKNHDYKLGMKLVFNTARRIIRKLLLKKITKNPHL